VVRLYTHWLWFLRSEAKGKRSRAIFQTRGALNKEYWENSPLKVTQCGHVTSKAWFKSVTLHMGHIDYFCSAVFFLFCILLWLNYWLKVINRCVSLPVMNINSCNLCPSVTMHSVCSISSKYRAICCKYWLKWWSIFASEVLYSEVYVALFHARYRLLDSGEMQNRTFTQFCSLYCFMIFYSIKHGFRYQTCVKWCFSELFADWFHMYPLMIVLKQKFWTISQR
jgi:hypothetical protein